MLKRDLLGYALVAILALSCFAACGPTGETCGDMTKWDPVAEKCIPEKVVECAKNTVRKDDKCVPVQEVCGDGKIYDAKEKKCVLKETICDKDSQFDEKTKACVPKKIIECGEGTVKKGDECLPKKVVACGPDTEEKDGKCVPKTSVCGKGTKLDEKTGKCETESKLDCGPGTQEKDGKCVPADDLCQPGTKADAQGRCVVGEVTCGPGTQLDANTKKCVTTDKACGPGTAFSKGKCVPTDKVCAKGTKFDAKLGQCLPDYCREGDILQNGVCTSPGEVLAAKKDVDEKENNDPALGGTPTKLTPKAIGATLVFQGTIEAPKDFNGDKTIDQDVDVYSFTAKAGQWYRVSVQSLGLSSPGLLVRGLPVKDSKGKVTGYEYKRFGSFAVSGSPTRHVFIPKDGDYEIVVLPSAVLATDQNLDALPPFRFGPIGSADAKYVGSLEQVKAPTPIKVDGNKISTLKGMVSMPAQSFFEVTNVQAKDLLELFTTSLGDSARFKVVLWDGKAVVRDSYVSGDNAYPVGVPASGKLWMLVTWELAYGPSLNFELRVRRLGKYEKTTIKKGANYSLSFSLPADSVAGVFFTADSKTFTSSYRLSVSLQDAGNKVIAENKSLNDTLGAPSSYTSTSYRLRGYMEKAGTYKVLVTNTTLADQVIEVYVLVFQASVLGKQKGVGDKLSLTAKAPILRNEYGWVVLNLKEDVSLNGSMTGLANAASDDVDMQMFDGKMKSLVYLSSTGPLTFDRSPFGKGTYLFRVYSSDSGNLLKGGFQGNLTLTAPPLKEKEPNSPADKANAWSLDTNVVGVHNARNDLDIYKFTLAADMKAGTLYELKVRSTMYSGVTCQLFNAPANAQPTLLKNVTGKRYGCYILVGGLKKGTYLFGVNVTSTPSSSSRDYTISAKLWNGTLEKEPNNTNTQALAIADVMKATVYGEISSKTDADYYSFKLAKALPAGDVLAIDISNKDLGNFTSSTYSAKVDVVDGTGKVIAAGGGNSVLYVKAADLKAGTDYFVKVSYSSSSYYSYYDVFYKMTFSQLTLSFVKETTAKNDDFATAQAIKIPVVATGAVAAGDKDYYKFSLAADLKAGEKLTFFLDDVGSGNTGSISFHVYDSKKKLLGQVSNYSYPKNLSLSGLKKGDYYFKVDRISTDASFKGNYTFTIKIAK